MKDYLECRTAKIDVLMNYWEKIEFQIMTNAAPNSKKGIAMDKEAQDFAMKLHRVPEKVRYAMLKKFVNRCRDLHQICFW